VIAEAEIRRQARAWSVDPMIVELDYVLGHFVSAWFDQPALSGTTFKGGTCLRKCYFADYRFSEDVDLTAHGPLQGRLVAEALESVSADLERRAGLNLRVRPFRVQAIADDPSAMALEARVYFSGPLRRTGWPQSIRIDITGGEWLAFRPVVRRLIHPYSDGEALGPSASRILCYDLREVLLEKLRGLAGQRRYAIARDVYDVHSLLTRAGLDIGQLSLDAPRKFLNKNVSLSATTLESLLKREPEFRLDWARNVEKVVPGRDRVEFEPAWELTVRAMAALVEAATQGMA